MPCLNFNSIKVQLELPAQRDIAQMTIFQFHKGTIRTIGFQNRYLEYKTFQFHKGTIRTSQLNFQHAREKQISIP